MNYYELPVNYEFAPVSFVMDQATTSKYLVATRDSNDLFRKLNYVPPMAVGALAMSAFSSAAAFPEGTVHVSQEFEFGGTVQIGDTISCLSRVSRNVHRGGMNLMSIDLRVLNQKQEKVLTGKVGVVLPRPDSKD